MPELFPRCPYARKVRNCSEDAIFIEKQVDKSSGKISETEFELWQRETMSTVNELKRGPHVPFGGNEVSLLEPASWARRKRSVDYVAQGVPKAVREFQTLLTIMCDLFCVCDEGDAYPVMDHPICMTSYGLPCVS